MGRHKRKQRSQKWKDSIALKLVDAKTQSTQTVNVSPEDVKQMVNLAQSQGLKGDDMIPVEVTSGKSGELARIKVRDQLEEIVKYEKYKVLRKGGPFTVPIPEETLDEPETLVVGSYNKRMTPMEWHGALLSIALDRLKNDLRNNAAFWDTVGRAVKNAEVFDFGMVEDEKLKVEAVRGGKLWGEEHLFLPYKAVVYWYTLKLDPKTANAEKLVMFGNEALPDAIEDVIRNPRRYCTIAVACPPNIREKNSHLLQGTGHVIAADFMEIAGSFLEGSNSVKVPGSHFFALCNAVVFCSEQKGWVATSIESMAKENVKEDSRLMGGLADSVVGLSMILATKGVELRREAPPPKVNAKRAKTGKPLLTTVTHVNTAHYYEAMANTHKGGTHASPRPHLRRGHIRRYKSGKTKFIKDMLINCRSLDEVKPRDHYEVETE